MPPLRLAFATIGFAVALGCQEPFGTDRHDLVGDRVVAITVSATDTTFRTHPWVVVDGNPWTDTAVDFAWYWLDPAAPNVDDITDEVPDATGPAPSFDVHSEPRVLGLITTFPSGQERRAQLAVPASGPTPLPPLLDIQLEAIDELDLEATEDDLALETRLARTTTEVPQARVGGWARLTAIFASPAPASTRVRWMTVGGRGTFLELDNQRTDWAAGDLVLDDLEIEEATPIEPGVFTVLALAVDGAAGNVARAQEHWLGPAEVGFVTAGRWLSADAEVSDAAWVRATLAADDMSPTGLALVDVTALDTAPDLTGDDPWQTASLSCAGLATEDRSAPFSPSWLFDSRCTRDDVVGATVILEASP